MIMENVQFLNADAFCEDIELTRELVGMGIGPNRQPSGVPLIPKQKTCQLCGGSFSFGVTILAGLLSTPNLLVHFLPLTTASIAITIIKGASDDCLSLPYFLSTQETGFELAMLKHFNVELLIGHISYLQKADIYNISNGYDTTKKQCSTIEKEKEARKQPIHV